MFSIREVSDSRRIFDLEENEVAIGRGPFLGVTDKRVSRNHGTLKLVSDGIEIKSTHVNPCFYARKLEPKKWIKLDRNETMVLNEGDVLSLLPKCFVYEVIKTVEAKSENTEESNLGGPVEQDASTPRRRKMKNHDPAPVVKQSTGPPGGEVALISPEEAGDLNSGDLLEEQPVSIPQNLNNNKHQHSIPGVIRSTGGEVPEKEVALSQQRKRKLPQWMMNISQHQEASTTKTPKRRSTTSTPKRRPTPSTAKRKRKVEAIKFESDEDNAEEKSGSMKATKDEVSENSNGGIQKVEDCETSTEMVEVADASVAPDDTSVMSASARLASNEASQNIDALVSHDSLKEAQQESPKQRPAASRTKKKPKIESSVSLSETSQNADASQGSSEEAQSESRRRRPTTPRSKKKSKTKASLALSESSQNADYASQGSSEADNQSSREPCEYGASCYRRNPQHRAEFSHPGDDDYEEVKVLGEKPECPYGTNCYRKNPLHKKQFKHSRRVAPKRQAKTKTKQDDESSSDDYDLDDSFLNDESEADDVDEDEDWDPAGGSQSQKPTRTSRRSSNSRKNYAESDSDATTDDSDLEDLVADAKNFSKNAKMWKK